EPPAVDHSRFTGTYRAAGAQLEFVVDDGRLVAYMTDLTNLTDQDDEPQPVGLPLDVVADGLYAVRLPTAAYWAQLRFSTGDDGHPNVHMGPRCLVKVE